jgi:hypothetical protein
MTRTAAAISTGPQLAARDRLSPADIEEIEALLKELKS